MRVVALLRLICNMQKTLASRRRNATTLFFVSFLLFITFDIFSRGRTFLHEGFPEVTFIIPSTGRPTLERTLASLKRLEGNSAWRAKVLVPRSTTTLSSLRIKRITADERISVIKHTHEGLSNCAGYVRNIGISQSLTPWVAFLDDDDTLSPNYLIQFVNERLAFPAANLIVFRMFDARISR